MDWLGMKSQQWIRPWLEWQVPDEFCPLVNTVVSHKLSSHPFPGSLTPTWCQFLVCLLLVGALETAAFFLKGWRKENGNSGFSDFVADTLWGYHWPVFGQRAWRCLTPVLSLSPWGCLMQPWNTYCLTSEITHAFCFVCFNYQILPTDMWFSSAQVWSLKATQASVLFFLLFITLKQFLLSKNFFFYQFLVPESAGFRQKT